MSIIDQAAKELSDIIRTAPADYIEVHLSETDSSAIRYRQQNLETIGKSSSRGGNIRALVDGGWGFTCFNDMDDLNKKVQEVIHQAKLASGPKIKLADVPVVRDTVKSEYDPTTVSLSRKKEIFDRYNSLIWETPSIQSSSLRYADGHKRQIFLNSEGSFITQERSDITVGMMAVANKGNDVQQANISIGNIGNFEEMTSLDDEIVDTTKKAVQMLEAPKIKAGEYTVVLDPVLAGVFVHEAFGHLSEADFTYENEQMKELMVLGKRFGEKHLNIVDGAKVPGLRGSYKYDDEGVESTKTYLIKEGILTGRLHSRETAAKMNEPVSGNARCVSYHFAPIVRMTNTYIEPQDATLDDLLAGIEEGVYAKNWYGGTTSMEMFTFSAGEAYMIRHGKIAEMIRPVVLSGNVFTTLGNIDAVGNDLDMNEGGGCGKGGQFPLPVSNGSPHIRIRHCLVGGA
ncbi:MAG: TldD/PmbA family protein [Dehalococcoidales bacterium]|jgi:TldD protein|nr:TldD/PmbA family protein [Dehalococcoidales bacterium]